MSDQNMALKIRGLIATLIGDSEAIKVEVEGGVVYLEGVTASPAMREQVEQLVLQVAGVEQVVNCLAVEHVASLNHNCAGGGFTDHDAYFLGLAECSMCAEQG